MLTDVSAVRLTALSAVKCNRRETLLYSSTANTPTAIGKYTDLLIAITKLPYQLHGTVNNYKL